MTEQFEKFVKVLREMFMIDDAADLDFGIYKVMHQKQADIEKYLSEDLQKNVQDEIEQSIGGRRRFVEKKKQKAKQGALSLGYSMSEVMNVPRVRTLGRLYTGYEQESYLLPEGAGGRLHANDCGKGVWHSINHGWRAAPVRVAGLFLYAKAQSIMSP